MTTPPSFLRKAFLSCLLAPAPWLSSVAAHAQTPPSAPRVIEILADHDSRFKIAGQQKPVIAVHAGELVTLRITAVKAKNQNRDGSIHGFTLLRPKDHKPVPDWDFLLKPGTQEFTLPAPREPGEYIVICTVICSQRHEGMEMKFIVLP